MSDKPPWQYYFARNFSVLRWEALISVLTSPFNRKNFGIHGRSGLVKPEAGRIQAIYFERGVAQRSIWKVFKVLCRNLQTFRQYQKIFKRVYQGWITASRRVGSGLSADTSLRELAKRYDHFVHWHDELIHKPIWTVFFVEPTLAAAAVRALQQVLRRRKKMAEYEHWFEVVFSAAEQKSISIAHQALLQMAVRIKSGETLRGGRRAALDRLTKKFQFIPCYDVIDEPWQREHFVQELEALLLKSGPDVRQELRNERSRYGWTRLEFTKLLAELRPTPRERELLVMAHELVFMKDERDDVRRRGCFMAQPLFTAISRRFGLTLPEVCMMSTNEIRQTLQTGVPVGRTELRRRLHGYAILFRNGRWTVTSGLPMRRLIQAEFDQVRVRQVVKVSGLAGSQGLARGRVVIVRTKHDLHRVRQGSIMVAVTTNPDFVPAMRKCVAIVTDEGGITSHAAIVCREFRIPGVVGTGNATTMFRTGDLVEVDGKTGLVRKL